MKRTFRIDVEVSDETEPPQSNFARVDGDGQYFIHVEPDCIPTYISFAHELGHIIGTEFKLPRTLQDYRLQTGVLPSSVDVGSLLIASENEAWDVAEILLRVRDSRTYAVGTYIREYEGKTVPPAFYPYNK